MSTPTVQPQCSPQHGLLKWCGSTYCSILVQTIIINTSTRFWERSQLCNYSTRRGVKNAKFSDIACRSWAVRFSFGTWKGDYCRIDLPHAEFIRQQSTWHHKHDVVNLITSTMHSSVCIYSNVESYIRIHIFYFRDYCEILSNLLFSEKNKFLPYFFKLTVYSQPHFYPRLCVMRWKSSRTLLRCLAGITRHSPKTVIGAPITSCVYNSKPFMLSEHSPCCARGSVADCRF